MQGGSARRAPERDEKPTGRHGVDICAQLLGSATLPTRTLRSMSDEFLEASWGRDDGDGIGELTVRAQARGFSGIGAAWFDRQTVLAFATDLDRYPLDVAGLPNLEGGYGNAPDFQPLLRLRAYPIGIQGQLGVRVVLVSDDYHTRERQCSVDLELVTSYQAVARFVAELRGIILHGAAPAVLAGDRFS